MVAGMGIFLLVAFIVAFLFKLEKEHYKVLLDEINRLKYGGNMGGVTPETNKIVTIS